jgi:hypothetical protein
MTNKRTRLGKLALIKSFADNSMSDETPDIGNYLIAISGAAKRQIDRLWATDEDIDAIYERLVAWEKATGWRGYKSTPTSLSFLSALTEGEQWQSIDFWLSRAIDVIEDGKGIPAPCEWAGPLAVERFMEVFEN